MAGTEAVRLLSGVPSPLHRKADAVLSGTRCLVPSGPLFQRRKEELVGVILSVQKGRIFSSAVGAPLDLGIKFSPALTSSIS